MIRPARHDDFHAERRRPILAFMDIGSLVLYSSDHERMPWGCRIVVEDPDGRPVEINQRGHCE